MHRGVGRGIARQEPQLCGWDHAKALTGLRCDSVDKSRLLGERPQVRQFKFQPRFLGVLCNSLESKLYNRE